MVERGFSEGQPIEELLIRDGHYAAQPECHTVAGHRLREIEWMVFMVLHLAVYKIIFFFGPKHADVSLHE